MHVTPWLGLAILVLLRVFYVLWRTHRKPVIPSARPLPRSIRRLAIVLGSGGHTAEMIRILAQLELSQHSPRLYIVSEGDIHSARLAHAFHEHRKTSPNIYEVVEVPRARRVKQPLLSTPWSATMSLFACARLMLSRRMSDIDVVMMNGPGTCVPICLAVFAKRLVNLRAPRLVYMESLARVKRLSLTAKLVQPFVDTMLVQWPDLEGPGSWWLCQRQYVGWLQ